MIVGVTTIRDEEDVIGPVLSHLVDQGVDLILCADNLSTDGTREIIDHAAETLPVTVIDDPDPRHRHGAKMSVLARQAHQLGATWVLPFDADEIWYGADGTIAEALSQVPDDVTIIRAPGWDHIVTQPDDAPFSPWRRSYHQTLAKVAFRAHPDPLIHLGNHGVEIPGRAEDGALRFRHFQYRSLEQMTRKLRDGRKAIELAGEHPLHCTHWRSGGLKTDAELAADWAEMCSEDGLVCDPVIA